jgi:hypothetical protein
MRTRGDCQSVVNHDDRGRRKKTELAMIHEAEGLKRLTKKLGEAEIDSIDSLICACDFPMLMRFARAHDALPCSCAFLYEREGITRVY